MAVRIAGWAHKKFGKLDGVSTVDPIAEVAGAAIAEPGQDARILAVGISAPAGRLPVNLSGGLKSKGHPIGAIGASTHVMAARQLAGVPAGSSAQNPRLGGVFNMGGAGVANCCSILERCN